MKKIYNRPIMKCINLLSAETLMTGSIVSVYSDESSMVEADAFLSNQESEHDIWGNSGNSIW